MSCNPLIEKDKKSATECKCYKAVMRTYGDLLVAGQRADVALEAAKIVYGYHHPEASVLAQTLIVERWVNEESLH